MTLGVINDNNRQRFSPMISEPSPSRPFMGKQLVKSAIRVISLSVLAGGLLTGTAYAHDTVLNGTLTIDFKASPAETAQPPLASELTFRIPNQGRIAGIRIPRTIEGQPFRGQEFTVSLVPNGCMLDGGPSHGQAHLRLTQKLRRQPLTASVFKAQVFGGQYECLFGGASQVLPYDPFDGNHQASTIGELLIWWTQILSNQQANTGLSVQDEILRFFGSSNPHQVERLRFWGVEYPSFQSRGCNSESRHIRCNRGGSADGVFNANVRVRFEDQDHEELQ